MKLENPLNFAAFIITYNRPKILKNTINNLLTQEYAPSEILIVDNSEDFSTCEVVSHLQDPKITYLRVGYNSGPAGGSKIGLMNLTKKGYKWIYWGDDNNPPRDSSVFKRMFDCLSKLEAAGEKIGAISGKGGSLNRLTGRVRSLSNLQLRKAEMLEADVFPGGHTVILNSEVVEKNILPEEKLFFAFEDFDMSIKLGKSGYKIFIDAQTWLDVRMKYGDTSNNYRPGKKISQRKKIHWNREYYSTRNLLFIFYNHKMFAALFFQILKAFFKIPLGFKYGMKYGWQNSKIQVLAVSSFLKGNYQNILKVD